MNTANIMAVEIKPKQEIPLKKNDIAADKVPPKSSAHGDAGKQDQAFDSALEDAKDVLDAKDEDKVAKPEGQNLLMMGFNPVIALVEVASAPSLSATLIAQGSEAALMQQAGTKTPLLQEQKMPIQTAVFTDLLQNAKPVKTDAQGLQPEVQPGSQQNASQPVVENSAAQLLQMLNGKTAVNAGVAAAAANAAQDGNARATKAEGQLVGDTQATLADVSKNLQKTNTPSAGENLLSDGEERNAQQNLAKQQDQGMGSTRESVADIFKSSNAKANETAKQTSSQQAAAGITGQPTETAVKTPEVNQPSTQQPFGVNVMDLRTPQAQTTAPAAAPQQTPDTTAKYNISEQIVEQARLIKTNEDTQMVIKLKPAHLGELSLKVTVENGVVSASFHSDNVQVRSMLESSLLQLKQDLAAQGIKVDSVGVYAGLGQFDSQNQAGRQQQGSSQSRNRKMNAADFEEEAEKVGAVALNRADEDGVDYRI